jgi:hypothetical protein
MHDRFDVSVRAFSRQSALPDAWPAPVRRALLDALPTGDIGDVDDADLNDVLLMALGDLEPVEGAEAIIDFRVHDGSSDGRREQLAFEFRDEHPWEEYPGLAAHADLFAVAMLLHDAWPKHFGRPSLGRVELDIVALEPSAVADLDPLEPSLLARLLGHRDPRSILARLFDDAVAGTEPFTDAPSLLWRVEVLDHGAGRCRVAVWSSLHWLAGVEAGQAWTSSASPDRDE